MKSNDMVQQNHENHENTRRKYKCVCECRDVWMYAHMCVNQKVWNRLMDSALPFNYFPTWPDQCSTYTIFMHTSIHSCIHTCKQHAYINIWFFRMHHTYVHYLPSLLAYNHIPVHHLTLHCIAWLHFFIHAGLPLIVYMCLRTLTSLLVGPLLLIRLVARNMNAPAAHLPYCSVVQLLNPSCVDLQTLFNQIIIYRF